MTGGELERRETGGNPADAAMSSPPRISKEITFPHQSTTGGHQLLEPEGREPDDRHLVSSARKVFDIGLRLAQQLRDPPAGSPHTAGGMAWPRTDDLNE